MSGGSILYYIPPVSSQPSTIHMENVATHQRRCALIHRRDTTPNMNKKEEEE